jgi:hypothetical protein
MTDSTGPDGFVAVDISVCRHVDEMPVEQTQLGEAPETTCRVLRRLPDGAIRSALFELPAGWSARGGRWDGATQLYVLDGALDLAGRRLGGGGFAVLRAGTPWPAIAARDSARVIVIFDAATESDGTSEPIVIEDVLTLPPFTPVIAGRRLDGFERRVLWEDATTGADTRLLRVPAGFRGGGPNWHPVNEEIFCIEGDIAPDETRPMRAGSFLWNPARSVHGFDEHTVGGCVLLEWHDGRWALHPSPEVERP